jgi:CRISPR/Cas system-associated exonuclease Cas4 (RecB family)
MPILAAPTVKPLTSWSFSRYSDYKKCPQFFKFKHLMGMKEPGNAAMERGTKIHKLAEDYAKGKLKKLPSELSLFPEEFKHLRAQKTKVIEDSWTWTQNWQSETRWDDWKGAWLRVKLDAAYLNTQHNALVVIDHKTGKLNDYRKPEYREQLELYGLAGLLKYPDVKVVSPRLWYLDAGVIYPDGEKPDEPELEYNRADEPKLRKVWLQRIEPMFKDKQYRPKQSNECRGCHFRKDNGGPCQY